MIAAIFGERDLGEPQGKVFSAHSVDVGMTINFYVVPHLNNVDAIKHIEQTLAFDRHCKSIVKHIEEDISSTFVGCSDSKIIYLLHEHNSFTVNSAGIQARFVGGRCQPDVPENRIRVFFPKTRRLGVSLHGRQNWNYLSLWYGWSFEVVLPPFVEGSVRANEEALFRRWCFSECIADVRTKNKEVFRGRDSVEEAGAGLVDAVSVDFVKDFN